eukprot:ctg_1475.g289
MRANASRGGRRRRAPAAAVGAVGAVAPGRCQCPPRVRPRRPAQRATSPTATTSWRRTAPTRPMRPPTSAAYTMSDAREYGTSAEADAFEGLRVSTLHRVSINTSTAGRACRGCEDAVMRWSFPASAHARASIRVAVFAVGTRSRRASSLRPQPRRTGHASFHALLAYHAGGSWPPNASTAPDAHRLSTAHRPALLGVAVARWAYSRIRACRGGGRPVRLVPAAVVVGGVRLAQRAAAQLGTTATASVGVRLGRGAHRGRTGRFPGQRRASRVRHRQPAVLRPLCPLMGSAALTSPTPTACSGLRLPLTSHHLSISSLTDCAARHNRVADRRSSVAVGSPATYCRPPTPRLETLSCCSCWPSTCSTRRCPSPPGRCQAPEAAARAPCPGNRSTRTPARPRRRCAAARPRWPDHFRHRAVHHDKVLAAVGLHADHRRDQHAGVAHQRAARLHDQRQIGATQHRPHRVDELLRGGDAHALSPIVDAQTAADIQVAQRVEARLSNALHKLQHQRGGIAEQFHLGDGAAQMRVHAHQLQRVVVVPNGLQEPIQARIADAELATGQAGADVRMHLRVDVRVDAQDDAGAGGDATRRRLDVLQVELGVDVDEAAGVHGHVDLQWRLAVAVENGLLHVEAGQLRQPQLIVIGLDRVADDGVHAGQRFGVRPVVLLDARVRVEIERRAERPHGVLHVLDAYLFTIQVAVGIDGELRRRWQHLSAGGHLHVYRVSVPSREIMATGEGVRSSETPMPRTARCTGHPASVPLPAGCGRRDDPRCGLSHRAPLPNAPSRHEHVRRTRSARRGNERMERVDAVPPSGLPGVCTGHSAMGSRVTTPISPCRPHCLFTRPVPPPW